MYDVQKKPTSPMSSGADKGAVQKKSLTDREQAKLGGFDVQMKKLSPEGDGASKKGEDKNVYDIQEPGWEKKYEEDVKNAPERKGIDAKAMAELEAAFQAATQPKVNLDALLQVIHKATSLEGDATPEQYAKIQQMRSVYVQNHPDKDKDVVDIN